MLERDDKNNATVGSDIHLSDTKDSMIFSATNRIIIANGVKNLVIVDSGEVLLVMNKDYEQELRKIVNHMRDEYDGRLT